MQATRQPWWWHPALRWAGWLGFVGAWTAALLYPRPAELAGLELSADAFFLISKALHVSAYAFLAVLTAALPLGLAWRWLLILISAAHAVSTEALQLLVPPRSGALLDVGFNLSGLALGVALTWRDWRKQQTTSAPTDLN